jgi:hypothetical protein
MKKKYKSVAHQEFYHTDMEEEKKDKSDLKPIPVLTPDLLSKIKKQYEYGILPPNYWSHYRDIHCLISYIESLKEHV